MACGKPEEDEMFREVHLEAFLARENCGQPEIMTAAPV